MPNLKIVTFNVFHDYPRARHVGRRLRLLADALVAEQPDIVFLQEMFVSPDIGHATERLVDDLRRRGLRYDSVYAPANGSFVENGIFEEGGAILSRLPIADRETRKLAPDHEVWRSHGDTRYVEQRIALRATLEVAPGRHLDVFSAHVTDTDVDPESSGRSPRALQIEDLGRFVATRPCGGLPAIVGGDLNATPDSEEVGWLRESGFFDPFDGLQEILTSDANDRDLENRRDTSHRRIDYVLVAGAPPPEVTVRDARLFLGEAVEIAPGRFLWASDHNGLIADLELPIA